VLQWNARAADEPWVEDKARRRRGRAVLVVVAVLGLFGSSALIYRASTAAFTATTTNGVNTFSAGTVALTDSDSGTAMFTVPGITPGQTGSACIRVTFNGSLASTVKVYTSGLSATGGLDSAISMQIETGATAPANAVGNFSCANFTPAGSLVTASLNALGTGATSFATGYGSWVPTGAGQTMDYRFTYTLPSNTGNAAQGASASISFVWEAQSN
jgi:hypothetical protein